jgi:hypothetical protein
MHTSTTCHTESSPHVPNTLNKSLMEKLCFGLLDKRTGYPLIHCFLGEMLGIKDSLS